MRQVGGSVYPSLPNFKVGCKHGVLTSDHLSIETNRSEAIYLWLAGLRAVDETTLIYRGVAKRHHSVERGP
jgi:hypothetical protein